MAGPGAVLADRGGVGVGQLIYQPPQVAGRPVSLAPRPALLAGREALLTELDARLTGGGGDGPRIIALHGLGGAGKTSVAVEYAHRHQATAGVAWQFPAEDRAVLAAEFARLAAQLGASGGVLDRRDPVASVHAALAASPAPWLLVFDNAPDRESVRAFLPPAGDGQVLITSQSALWPPGQALEVPVLGTEVAAGFLAARTGDADTQAATDLARELGGLPLALEQAGAYVQAAGSGLAGYLAMFRQRRADLLARGEPAGYAGTVATTWALALGRLGRDAPQAGGLLRLLACCAPEPVPLPLILQSSDAVTDGLGGDVASALIPLLGDRLAAGDAVAALRRYSLVTLAGDGLVLVHRLVQAITVDQMTAELAGQWRQAAAALIEAAIPAGTALPGTWPACAVLLPHAQAAVPYESGGMARIADYLGQRGAYPAARDLQQMIADAREQAFGAEHPDTLNARAGLAAWTGEAGDPAAARDQLAALLPVRERISGPEHADTLDVRSQLAHWTGEAGDPAAARDQLAALLPVRERISGPEHADTLDVRSQLAHWTGEAGDPAAARDSLAALLPLVERLHHPEHPGALEVRRSLADWTGVAGDPASARDLFTALLPIRERILGPEHPATLITHGNLAHWIGEAGDPAVARDLAAALLPVEVRVLGPEHPDTLGTRHTLAYWTGEAGDPAAARDLFTALLPIRERVLGREHPDTLATGNRLTYWTQQAAKTTG